MGAAQAITGHENDQKNVARLVVQKSGRIHGARSEFRLQDLIDQHAQQVAMRANYRTALEFIAEHSAGWIRQFAVDVLDGSEAEMAISRSAYARAANVTNDDALTGDVELLGSHA